MRAVIFDMDGVLIDTEKHLVRLWRQAAAEFGYEMKREHALMIRSLAGEFAGRNYSLSMERILIIKR